MDHDPMLHPFESNPAMMLGTVIVLIAMVLGLALGLAIGFLIC